MNITILGDGGWGTALSKILAENGHAVKVWGAFPEYLEELAAKRVNRKFLPGVPLPDSIRYEADMGKAVAAAEMVVLATPTQFLRGVLNTFHPYFQVRRHLLVNVAKGIEEKSLKRIGEITLEILGPSAYAVLSGPSHAEESARGIPTAVAAASSDPALARTVRDAFMNRSFRVYTTNDVIGVELGGALKNVIALAAGIIDGMELGDNPKAALLTRGIAEMGRLGRKLGGNPETFAGLSGIGDLIVTCASRHSRNRHVGEELGRGRKLDEIIAAMQMSVAEGVKTAPGAKKLAEMNSVQTPIIDQIYEVLYNGKSPESAIDDLMRRDPKSE
ncbi:MAG: NAD(P)-dependent glycerol-3-phosphate dehydrogenase [Victivallaceae bacterium]|nr:NAD(P)-dependent glycerol-3-phosphate dehydrogenase [Victivallaceae bacterium]